MIVEQRIETLGLYLPEATKVPAGIQIDFAWARVFGDRVYVSDMPRPIPTARSADRRAGPATR